MKTNVMRMFLAISTVSVFGGALHAQSFNMKADVPFAFRVNDKTFEPGTYNVRRDTTAFPFLRNETSGESIFIANRPTDGVSHSPKLVFHCYSGKQCFLAEIWSGAGAGNAVPKSKAEKNLLSDERAREMATVAINLRLAD
jgi:hypothetical protein